MGASLRETGSREPSPAVSALSGFDPARCRLQRYDAISSQIIDEQGFVLGLILQLTNGRWIVEIDGGRRGPWSCRSAKAAFLTWRNKAIASQPSEDST